MAGNNNAFRKKQKTNKPPTKGKHSFSSLTSPTAPSLPVHSPDRVMIKTWGTEGQAMQYTRKNAGLRVEGGLAS